MALQVIGKKTQATERVSLGDLYRTGLTPEQDAYVWRTIGRDLLIILSVALAVRLPYYRDGFRPLNDGGMFALILDHLRVTGLRWPSFIDYNHLHIPLSYPPLGFYLGALATFLPLQNTLLVMTWLPLFFNLATVAAAYFIAHEVFGDPFLRVLTGVAYSIIGGSAIWLTMGGGITRSPGEFFALVTIALFLRSCNRSSIKIAMACGVFGGLTLLTHLECSTLVAISLPVLALAFPHRIENLTRMTIAGCVGMLVTLPWLFWVWTHVGFSPLMNAFHSGFDAAHHDSSLVWITLAGVLLTFAARFPYVLWLVAEFVLMRRNANTHSVVIRAIILVWISSVIVTVFAKFIRRGHWKRAVTAAIAIGLAISMLGTIRKRSDRLEDLDNNERAQLSVATIEAMQAVPKYTAADARFIVLSERTEIWYEDFPSEWFPYYSGRQCINTVQGREWLPDRDFKRAAVVASSLLALSGSPNFDELIYKSEPEYLVVMRPMDENHEAVAKTYLRLTQPTPVYKNQDVEVLAFDKQKVRLAAAKYAAAFPGGAK